MIYWAFALVKKSTFKPEKESAEFYGRVVCLVIGVEFGLHVLVHVFVPLFSTDWCCVLRRCSTSTALPFTFQAAPMETTSRIRLALGNFPGNFLSGSVHH